MPFEISYDPSLNKDAGYVEIADPAGKIKPLRPRDRQTLLFLLFKLLYTLEGRNLMRKNKPENGQLTQKQEDALRTYFADSGVTSVDLQNALLDAHKQADTWATAYRAGPKMDTERLEAERIYLQKMAFITWCLWEDAKGHEFSMGW